MAKGIIVGRGLGAFPKEVRGIAANALMEAHRQPMTTQAATLDDSEILDPGVDITVRPQVQEYQIGDITYELREPVLIQEVQLIELLRKTDANVGTLDIDLVDLIVNPANLIDKLAAGVSVDMILGILGAKVPRFFAIILTPKGQAIKDKDVDAVEVDLLNTMTLTNQGDVMSGFFRFAESLGKAIAVRAKKVQAEALAAAKTRQEKNSSTPSLESKPD